MFFGYETVSGVLPANERYTAYFARGSLNQPPRQILGPIVDQQNLDLLAVRHSANLRQVPSAIRPFVVGVAAEFTGSAADVLLKKATAEFRGKSDASLARGGTGHRGTFRGSGARESRADISKPARPI